MKHNPTTGSFHKQTCSSPDLNSHILQNQMGNHKPSLKTAVPGQVHAFSQVSGRFCIPLSATGDTRSASPQQLPLRIR